MLLFLSWWVIIQLFALAALPLVRRVFCRLPGQGYAFAKTAGLLLVSYLLWLGAASGLLVNDAGGITLALLVVAGVSLWLGLSAGRDRAREAARAFWRENRGQILAVETLFLVAFAGWTLVRAYAPDKILPAGGEKYMEIAFLNGVLNSPQFPPLDPWLAGFGISYYYFGYVMMGILTRLSGAAPTVAFDLYDALLFALTAATAYGVLSSLVAAAGGSQRAAGGAGLLGALFVTGLGNLQGLLEGLYASGALPQPFWTWLDIPDLAGSPQSGSFYPGHGWWWWRASRVLRDLDLFYQPVPYQPIDEFPFFSFLLGDNHPHKLALPFALLAIGLAFNLLLHRLHRAPAGEPGAETPAGLSGWRRWAARAWVDRREAGLYLFTALGLGSLGFLNTWDLPIYLALAALAFAAGEYLAGRRLDLGLLGRAAAFALGMGAASLALYILFYISFASQAGGILPYIFPPTRLAQYLVMFGPFTAILAFFLLAAARQAGQGRFPWRLAARAWLWTAGLLYGLYLGVLLAAAVVIERMGARANPLVQPWFGDLDAFGAAGRALAARLANPWLFLLLSLLIALAVTALLSARGAGRGDPARPGGNRAAATSFAVLLALAGLGLTLSVEFFYLRDSFGLRMNTIFKFYFQGWVLLACASAYGVWWVARSLRGTGRAAFAVVTAALVAAGLVYPLMAVYSRTEGFSRRPDLDAAASVSGAYPGHWAAQPDDWAAITWLNEQVRPEALRAGRVPVILEAPVLGYQHGGRVSAFTGLPTLLGWMNHESQWRGSNEEIDRRLPDIRAIFTTPDPAVARDLLETWQVEYVIVGDAERAFIEQTCAQPETACNPTRALAMFERIATPVFQQGGTTVYRVNR